MLFNDFTVGRLGVRHVKPYPLAFFFFKKKSSRQIRVLPMVSLSMDQIHPIYNYNYYNIAYKYKETTCKF